ncbi:MAG: hypothetical protein K0S53_680 [Bacteroidetes bacterium]|jgi:hypothetical protein|nr:hypothetical protein [Bacteroidota bacterium]
MENKELLPPHRASKIDTKLYKDHQIYFVVTMMKKSESGEYIPLYQQVSKEEYDIHDAETQNIPFYN